MFPTLIAAYNGVEIMIGITDGWIIQSVQKIWGIQTTYHWLPIKAIQFCGLSYAVISLQLIGKWLIRCLHLPVKGTSMGRALHEGVISLLPNISKGKKIVETKTKSFLCPLNCVINYHFNLGTRVRISSILVLTSALLSFRPYTF